MTLQKRQAQIWDEFRAAGAKVPKVSAASSGSKIGMAICRKLVKIPGLVNIQKPRENHHFSMGKVV